MKKNDTKRWYKDAIIYQSHVRSFNDSNDDGIGDFKGLIEKLDYLKSLGVNAIWIFPFYKSPLRDGGYDISDFTAFMRIMVPWPISNVLSAKHIEGITGNYRIGT